MVLIKVTEVEMNLLFDQTMFSGTGNNLSVYMFNCNFFTSISIGEWEHLYMLYYIDSF